MSRTFETLLRRIGCLGAPGSGPVVMRSVLAGLLGLTLAGCGSTSPTTSSGATSPSTTATDRPVRAEDADDHFQLVFELPKATWRTTEPIEGRATLTLIGASSMNVTGSGSGLLGFEFLGGDKRVGWVMTADCAPYRIDASEPIVAEITKTVGYSADAAPTNFYRLFGTDPLIHLPTGDWTITVVTSFSEGQACTGLIHALRASVLIHIEG